MRDMRLFHQALELLRSGDEPLIAGADSLDHRPDAAVDSPKCGE